MGLQTVIVNWRKWGLGFSIEFGDPAFLRLWLGPVRIGWKWGHV
jgi:hypothetical protein